jgi:hypothetical protein
VDGAEWLPLPPPLTTTAPLLLNLGDLTWEAVEHLVVALAREVDQAREARLYGRRGQRQHGIDVVAFFDCQPTTVYQAKRYAKFTAGDLRAAVAAFSRGPRPFGASRLVVVTTADIADTRIEEALASERAAHPDLSIELWGRVQLSDKLLDQPKLVRRFFGEETVRVFCRLTATRGSTVATAEIGTISAYCEGLAAHLAGAQAESAELDIEVEESGEVFSAAELADRVVPGRQIAIGGASGAGKSHLLVRVARDLLARGWLPILVRASFYDGQLDQLLDETIAQFTDAKPSELAQSARSEGCTPVLLVDALNECAPAHRSQLSHQLSAWCARERAALVTTSTDQPYVSSHTGVKLLLKPPSDEQRLALIRMYGAQDTDGRFDAFATPFELSLAAQLAQELPEDSGPANLFDCFIRDRLNSSASSGVRRVLHRWALAMDDHLETWLPLAEAERLAQTTDGVSTHEVDSALSCALITQDRRRLYFRHEIFERFLAAEALRWRADTPVQLAEEMSHPHHSDLAEFALPLEHDPQHLLVLAKRLSDAALIEKALLGRLGALSKRVLTNEALRLLSHAVEVTGGTTVALGSEPFDYTVDSPYEWSAYEIALLTAIGGAARHGLFFHEIVVLLRETGAACWRGTEGQPESERRKAPAVTAFVLESPYRARSGERRLPAGWINHALRLSSWSSLAPVGALNRASASDMARLLDRCTPADAGELMLLCHLVQRLRVPEVAPLVPRLLALAWWSGANHLKGAALDAARYVRTVATPETSTAIINALNNLNSNNLFVSTLLVETLYAYDQIESPHSVDAISSEIAELLTATDAPGLHQRALSVVVSQFEDVIAAPYIAAIEALTPLERTQLLTLAVQSQETSLFTGVLLNELLQGDEPAALPAFAHWAARLEACGLIQDEVTCHLYGVLGCAARTESPPPLLTAHSGADADAWRCYDQIIFWLHRPGLSLDVRAGHCEPFWDLLTASLLDAAVDPLHAIHQASFYLATPGKTPLYRLLDARPDATRLILTHGLQQPERITSLTRHPFFSRNRAAAIHLLSLVGDDATIAYLERLRGDADVGRQAVGAIRTLKARLNR